MPMVFTYGPGTLQGRMYDRIGPTDVIGSAVLKDKRLVFDKPNMKNKEEGLPNVVDAPGDAVFGLVFELKNKQLELLDGFFGGYEQRSVPVQIGDPPVTRKVITWVARRTKAGLKPSAETIDMTRAGMEENDAPASFIEALSEYEVLMSNDTGELIILFKNGVSESSAQAVVAALGGSVRRRMRTDDPDQVMLLARVADDVEDKAQEATRHPDVEKVEVNKGGFGIR